MTTLSEAAQQALEALEFSTLDAFMLAPISPGRESTIKAITALRAALAEPVQEPTFHGFMSADGTRVDLCFSPSAPRLDGTYATAYYTAPPQRPAEPVQEPAPMPPFPPVSLWKRGCAVCGIGAGGHAYGYACPRSDCPTRVTCGGVV